MQIQTTRLTLLSRVRNPGDAVAWSEFERTYREFILRYARRRGLQAADAEDVLQIVMVALVRTLPGFTYDPQRGRFRGYLYRVVRNAIVEYSARPRVDRAALEPSVLEAVAADRDETPDATWEEEWVAHHYRLALAGVREVVEPRSLAVFERLMAGATVEQAAAEFDLQVAAVHKIKQRVRDRLQALIAQQIREEDSIDG